MSTLSVLPFHFLYGEYQQRFTPFRKQEKVMVFHPVIGNNVAEVPTIEVTHEGLRSLLNQIEAELLDSEVYRRTMAGLQTMLGEGTHTAQILVKAVGREAVRLTFQEFARQYKLVPIPSDKTHQVQRPESVSPAVVEDKPIEKDWQPDVVFGEEFTELIEPSKPDSLVNRLIGDTKPNKKRTKKKLPAQIATQTTVQTRTEIIVQIGKQLRHARLSRSLSLLQLHNQTLVPIHLIEAVENGDLDKLPEDVYIRGFILRIAHALGLNGVEMANSLPESDPVKSVVPSWHNNLTLPGLQVKSVHLYLGYTALIAGAVGGLSWMSNQSTQKVSVELPPIPTPSIAVSPKFEPQATVTNPGIKSSQAGIQAEANIAPPETVINR
jgi:cytoskeleton protein RodZ